MQAAVWFFLTDLADFCFGQCRRVFLLSDKDLPRVIVSFRGVWAQPTGLQLSHLQLQVEGGKEVLWRPSWAVGRS